MASESGEGAGLPPEGVTPPLLPKIQQETSRPSENVVTHLKEKKKVVYGSTQAITSGLLDVYKGVFIPSDQPIEKQTDLEGIKAEINDIPKDKNPHVVIVKAKDAVVKVHGLEQHADAQLKDLDDTLNAPHRAAEAARQQLQAKMTELKTLEKSGVRHPLNFISWLKERRRLKDEVASLDSQQEQAGQSTLDYDRTQSLFAQLQGARATLDSIYNLGDRIVRGSTETLTSAVVDEYAPLLGEIHTDDELQRLLFDHALQSEIDPRLNKLVVQGILFPDQAAEYMRIIQQDFIASTTDLEEAEYQTHARQTRRNGYETQIVGLSAIADSIKGLSDREYSSLFALAFKQEAFQTLEALQQQVRDAGLGDRTNDIVTLLQIATGDVIKPQINTMWSHLPSGVKTLWATVRGSEAGELLDQDTWSALEKTLSEHAFFEFTLSRFNKTGNEPEHFFSLIKNNPELRRLYIPRVVQYLGMTMDGYSSRVPGVRMFDFVTSISDSELVTLSEDGFDLSALKTIIEQNPQTFDRFYPTEESRQRKELSPAYQALRVELARLGVAMLARGGSGWKVRDGALDNISSAWGSLYHHGKYTEILDANRDVPREHAAWACILLRRYDRMLRNVPDDKRIPPVETRERFADAIFKLKDILQQAEIPEDSKRFLSGEAVLGALARQPEKIDPILDLVLRNEKFVKLKELMSGDGPLAFAVDSTLEEILSSGNPQEFVETIISDFTKEKPHWETLFDICRRVHGGELKSSNSAYPVTTVVMGDRRVDIQTLISEHKTSKQQDPSKSTPLEEMLGNSAEVTRLEEQGAAAIPFAKLSGMWKEKIFGQFLRDAVEISRDQQAKLGADQRNKQLAVKPLEINNMYVHGTAIDSLAAILLNGNLPRQVLGVDAAVVGFPFHAQFIEFTQKPGEQKTLGQLINEHERLGLYGSDQRHGGRYGSAGQIFLLYDRSKASYQRGINHSPDGGGWENHRIVLGGMPAPELTGIKLRHPEATLDMAKRLVVENGFYTPIYDYDNDSLIFTPDDYEKYKAEWNLGVQTPVWEYSFKIGEAKGSHKPAGEYVVPTPDGALKTFYVKFANYDFPVDEQNILTKELEEQNRIWNEYLADRIYKHFGVPVPNTAVVKVNRVVGHASEEINDMSTLNERDTSAGPSARAFARVSEIIRPDEAETEGARMSVKEGFLVDALLANWDIAKGGNVIYSEGKAIRIDNGGALLFRARGERKTSDEFGATVQELETMRESYPGLTNEDIQQQLATLQEKFTNGAIDGLVDSVRLHRSDRDFLRNILKQRRDYILNYFQGGTPATV